MSFVMIKIKKTWLMIKYFIAHVFIFMPLFQYKH